MEHSNRILLIGHNFFPEPTGIGKYSGEMMQWLSKKGHDCTVVTTYPYYPYWKVQEPYRNGAYHKELISQEGCDQKVTVYRCPLYVPKKLTGIRRMTHDFSFLITMFFAVLKLIIFDKGFDYIITVAPPFHLGFLAILYRMLRGGKVIYHIQDLQIEAAQESNMLKGEKLFKLLYSAERVMLRNSDMVSSISQGMIKRVQAKVDKPVTFFPNWVETTQFFPIADKASLKEEWGYDKGDFICLYSGSIGEKQGLESIIYSAEALKDNPKVQFVICGTGPYKAKLQELVLNKKLTNINFMPLQDKNKFNSFLNMADLHLVIQKAFIGDLVMPSKLQTILAVGGVSLVTAEKSTSLYELIEHNNLGFSVTPEDYSKLAESIADIAQTDITIKQQNARKYALKYLNIDNVMNRFAQDITNMHYSYENALIHVA